MRNNFRHINRCLKCTAKQGHRRGGVAARDMSKASTHQPRTPHDEANIADEGEYCG